MCQVRTLLLGAGAEAPLGIGTGADFTLNTFCKKDRNMYDALAEYYRGCPSQTTHAVPRYQRQFLLSSKSPLFKQLLESVLRDQQLVQKVFLDAGTSISENDLEVARRDLITNNKLDVGHFTADALSELMNLIVEYDDSLACIAATHGMESAHYGLLESYYSSLISPVQNESRIWKLINFYWTAFFYIIKPILKDAPKHEGAEWTKSDYLAVLNNLPTAVDGIFMNKESIINSAERPYHQPCAMDSFDYALTTNYTPYTECLFNGSEQELDNKIAWLSGRIDLFERIDTLSTFNIRKLSSPNMNHCSFPFLMCQSPVKPIVNSIQIREYSKALAFLDASDEIAVLGYSFCQEDTHIVTMVSEALNRNLEMRLIYFNYCHGADTTSTGKVRRDLFKKLRLNDERQLNQIEVVQLSEGDPAPFLQYARYGHKSQN